MTFDEFDIIRVDLDDAKMAVRLGGAGPALVLLHGFPQHSLMWRKIAPLLADWFTMIVPDQRGMGASTIPTGAFTKTDMARDLAAMLDGLGHDRVSVAGYDLGAGVAVALARDYPERTERLAVMEFGVDCGSHRTGVAGADHRHRLEGHRRGSRAVGAAMPFVDRAERVLVMAASEDDKPNDATQASANRLVATLQRHAPLVHAQHVPQGLGSAAEALLAAAMEARASLLVMGVYGHGELRESIFGGFTRTFLGGAEQPVLMMR